MAFTNIFGILASSTDNSEDLFAFKRLYKDDSNLDCGIQNLTEIDILSRFMHPNIIRSLEITLPKDYKIYDPIMILPLADYTLNQLLLDNFLTTRKKLPLLYKIAHAINFLHNNSFFCPVLTLDDIVVQSVGDSLNPLLTNFSLARYEPTCHHDLILQDIRNFACLFINFVGRNPKEHIELSEEVIDDQIKHIHPQYRTICKDFLTKLIKDSSLTFKDICNHDIFKEFKTEIVAGTKCPDIISDYPKDHRDIVKIIYNWVTDNHKDYSIELIFLSIDLFNRAVVFYNDKNSDYRLHVAATCLWISLKLLKNSNNIPLSHIFPDLVKLFPKLSKDTILQLESEIIQNLSGILLVNNLYCSCKTIGDLDLSLIHIILNKENPNTYSIVDVPQWISTINKHFPDKNTHTNKNILISKYLTKDFQ